MKIKKEKPLSLKVKPFINKRNKQISFTIPKRQLKKMGSDLKFNEDLFIEMKILRGKKSIKNG